MIGSLEREFCFDLLFPGLTAKLLTHVYLAPAARIVTDSGSSHTFINKVMKSTAKIKLKAGPDTELLKNDLFFFFSLSSVPSDSLKLPRHIISKQQSCRWFREISSVEWRGDPLTRELVSVSPEVQWSAVTSLFLLLYPCLLAQRGKVISWHATGYSLLPEDESLWDQQPSEAQWWLPALEDLWVHFYHKDLNALRRTLPSALEEIWGWPSEGGALPGSSQPEEHQKHYCYCWELLQEGMVWFSNLQPGICASGTECYCSVL